MAQFHGNELGPENHHRSSCGCSSLNLQMHHGSLSSSCLPALSTRFAGFVAAFLLGMVTYSCWNNTLLGISPTSWKGDLWSNIIARPQPSSPPARSPLNLNCSQRPLTCGPPERREAGGKPPPCPEYFRWIHDDLRPWKKSGITREMVESGRQRANFRLVVVEGRAYVQHYSKAFQTRDVFTLWGIVQLLRLHGHALPDLDLMFDCNDTPEIKASDYAPLKAGASPPPPLFRYCADDSTVQIVFPDWSFWGWAEINIKPWEALRRDLKEGSMRIPWLEREPYAFWKGNPWDSKARTDLLSCNPSQTHDWNARLFIQDWKEEIKRGFKRSNLADQCTYRYKIYVEGRSWSVSKKYILACDSLVLMVKSRFQDFFSRGLVPLQHYWPINDNDTTCSSIQFAVSWGNNHTHKAQLMGKEGSGFVEKELTMEHVYNYMFHALSEYSKLLTYKPTVPEEATEICVETMACPEEGLVRQFMLDSMADTSSPQSCTLPPPLDLYEKEMLRRAKDNSIQQVEAWERGQRTAQETG